MSTDEQDDRDDLAGVVAALEAIGLEPEQIADRRVMVELTGQWRRGLPVLCTVEERHLRVTALLAGAVEERHAEVYRFLLTRNERAGDVHTALDNDGDVLLVARLPLVVVDAGALDELLGELLTVADETFNTVLGTGFASYVEREQRWRELRDQPDNPAFPTGGTASDDEGDGRQGSAEGGAGRDGEDGEPTAQTEEEGS